MSSHSVQFGAVVIAASILLSRVLGVLRDVLLAKWAGLQIEKSAYDLAFLVPDILNHLVSTGYLSITFIPIFSGFLQRREPEKAWEFFSTVLTCMLVVFVPLLVLAWIWMEPLIRLLLPTNPHPEVLSLAVGYSRIILPAQACFLAGALYIAIQHVNLRFAVPALSGVLYNLCIIAGGFLGRESGLQGFAWGVLAGAGTGGFLLQIWGGRRVGARFRFLAHFGSPHWLRYLSLTLPLVLGVGAMFAMELLFRAYGPRFGTSGIASLGYAYRMMYTLVAVFGFSAGTASYPRLARWAKEGRLSDIGEALLSTLGKIWTLLVPAAVCLGLESESVTGLLFQRGAFDAVATQEVAALFLLYLPASFSLSAQVVVLRCFYSREIMWLPTLLNSGIFCLSLPLYEILPKYFHIKAVPIAGAGTATVQLAVLLFAWYRTAGPTGAGPLGLDALKIAVAAIVAGGCGAVWKATGWQWPGAGGAAAGVLATTLVVCGVFGLIAWQLRLTPFLELAGSLRRRVSRRAS